MTGAIDVQWDYSGTDLRRLAWRWVDVDQERLLLALALILLGGSKSEAAKFGGVTFQIVRNWVLRSNAEGPGGQLSLKAPGKAWILNDTQRRALAADRPGADEAENRLHAQKSILLWCFGLL